MNKYKIEVKEQYTGVYDVEGENFDEAKYLLEEKIDSEEIILDNIDTYIRNYENSNSKELREDINILISYDSKNKIIKIFNNNEKLMEGDCYTVRDLKEIFENFCINELDDNEIPNEIMSENNMEV